MGLNALSASTIANRIAAGDTSSEAVVEACLARIAEREPSVHAWAFIDPGQALEQARQRDRSARLGPLHGVPIAVKDIIDTSDMPTAMGSPIYAGNRPVADGHFVETLHRHIQTDTSFLAPVYQRAVTMRQPRGVCFS